MTRPRTIARLVMCMRLIPPTPKWLVGASSYGQWRRIEQGKASVILQIHNAFRISRRIVAVPRSHRPPSRTSGPRQGSRNPEDRSPRHGLARVLSKRGIASRSRAAEWIRAGRVGIAGRIVLDPEFPV